MLDQEKERERFEVDAKKLCLNIERDVSTGGLWAYRDIRTWDRWEAWLARAALDGAQGVGEPVVAIYVSAEQIDSAAGLPSTYLPFRLAPEGKFQTPLYRTPATPAPGCDAPENVRERIAYVSEQAGLDGASACWRPCTGCHETSDGYSVGFPRSKTFGCEVGSGCRECGGLGVVWEHYSAADLAEMAKEAAAPAAPPPAAEDVEKCPICAEPFKVGDTCATDINEGTCHAACLEGSPVVDLDSGEETGGEAGTFPWEPDPAVEGVKPAAQTEYSEWVSRAAASIADMVADWYRGPARGDQDIPGNLIMRRLERFLPPRPSERGG